MIFLPPVSVSLLLSLDPPLVPPPPLTLPLLLLPCPLSWLPLPLLLLPLPLSLLPPSLHSLPSPCCLCPLWYLNLQDLGNNQAAMAIVILVVMVIMVVVMAVESCSLQYHSLLRSHTHHKITRRSERSKTTLQQTTRLIGKSSEPSYQITSIILL